MNLEAEVERAKSKKGVHEQKNYDEKLADCLKQEAEQARMDAEKFEREYIATSEDRDKIKNELEEMRRMYAALERRMKAGRNEKKLLRLNNYSRALNTRLRSSFTQRQLLKYKL